MIADLVAATRGFTRDLRQALHIAAALKKSRGDVLIGQHTQQGGCGFARTIVKCEGNGAPSRRASIHRGCE